MVYIHAIGIHNTIPQQSPANLRSELQTISGKIYRRSDHFIQLAIIGAHKAVGDYSPAEKTAVYMTSGQGNLSVFERICQARIVDKFLPKPVDFINLLSNSAGFYVASHLGLNGKNVFLSHDHFPVQMTMLIAENDIKLNKQKAILVGGVDEWLIRQDLARKILGVSDTTSLGEGSNWLLLSSEASGAIGRFAIRNMGMNEKKLHDFLAEEARAGVYLAFSSRFNEHKINEIMAQYPLFTRYEYEKSCGYYETLPFYVLNSFLGNMVGSLLHIDVKDGKYMVMAVETI